MWQISGSSHSRPKAKPTIIQICCVLPSRTTMLQLLLCVVPIMSSQINYLTVKSRTISKHHPIAILVIEFEIMALLKICVSVKKKDWRRWTKTFYLDKLLKFYLTSASDMQKTFFTSGGGILWTKVHFEWFERSFPGWNLWVVRPQTEEMSCHRVESQLM